MFIIQPPSSDVSIDLAHATLLTGIVASLKPNRIVELGYGAGYTSRAIMQAIHWNGHGLLTIVDNWIDWGGVEPDTTELRMMGAEFVVSDEEQFVRSAADSEFDILVSDADHHRSDLWIDHHLRIVRPGGFLFFHDVGSGTTFRNLESIPIRLNELGISHTVFQKSSKKDERCDRGWLMMQKP